MVPAVGTQWVSVPHIFACTYDCSRLPMSNNDSLVLMNAPEQLSTVVSIAA